MPRELHLKKAFPGEQDRSGMTLLDWFAGQALIGLVSNTTNPANVGAYAYDAAELMMKERKRRVHD